MKRNPLITYLIASSCVLGACTTTVVDESDLQDTAISFSTPETRAAVEGDLPDGSDFKIWGYRTSNEAPNKIITDFDGEKVHGENGIWNYEGGTRYWIPGYNYNFYALYPFYPTESQNGGTTAKCDENGNLTVANFDCSKTGEEAVDLMATKQTEIDGTNPPPSVSLTFNHLLSRVLITAKVVGGSATVHSVSFSGPKIKGSYTSDTSGGSASGWTLEGNPYTFQKTEEIPLKLEETSLFGDMLLLPQEIVVSGEKSFKMNVSYTVDEEHLEKEIHFSNETVSSWEAGKSYKYTLTIKGNNIGFGVNVIPWNHSTGGIITVE